MKGDDFIQAIVIGRPLLMRNVPKKRKGPGTCYENKETGDGKKVELVLPQSRGAMSQRDCSPGAQGQRNSTLP